MSVETTGGRDAGRGRRPSGEGRDGHKWTQEPTPLVSVASLVTRPRSARSRPRRRVFSVFVFVVSVAPFVNSAAFAISRARAALTSRANW